MLSSSFAMTPAVVKRKLRLVPTSRVSEELLSKTSSRQDFIRIIPNPGYRPNSMKNVPKATPTTSATSGATLRPPYAVCDPRKVQILQQQMQQAALANGTGAFGGANKPFSRSNSHNADLNSLDGSDANAQSDSTGQQPPKPYLKLSSSNMSKQRFKKFNYASVNVSCICFCLSPIFAPIIILFSFRTRTRRVWAWRTMFQTRSSTRSCSCATRWCLCASRPCCPS